jgi:hypothetical protein
MLDKLQAADFQPHLNEIFHIQLDETQSIDLELISVTELGGTAQVGERGPFSLHFLGPVSTQHLQQHTYHLENETMGAFDFFIVPLGAEAGRMRYEAIFT